MKAKKKVAKKSVKKVSQVVPLIVRIEKDRKRQIDAVIKKHKKGITNGKSN